MTIKRLFSELPQPSIAAEGLGEYLFAELSRGDDFTISGSAIELQEAFIAALKKKRSFTAFTSSIDQLHDQPLEQFRLLREWLRAFCAEEDHPHWAQAIPEAALLFLAEDGTRLRPHHEGTEMTLDGLQGDHPRLRGGVYATSLPEFLTRLRVYTETVVPDYTRLQQLKRERIETYRRELQLASLQPKVMSAFVRNRLIDEVYLPLIGDNLAKQLGTAGEDTRTDRMGLLLLLSPPGYGKTTLMEYIANRLGLIFMKVNGPTIGHRVRGLDPADAPNRAAAKELQRLNLSFEMGDNVMIYIDDIQHCHPEFLQQFISLCDGQRRIEGVWKGAAKTYDFRSRRMAVVMAGNPYTESGDRFRIPDMLANRADSYNLGDIIGGREEAFRLSYLENALTSNPTLARLANKSMADTYALIRKVEGKEQTLPELEAGHSPAELREYQSVLEKLVLIRDRVLQINRAYIRSAAVAEKDRTEPPFRLQGSYRNMNKLAEKVVPVMNEQEVVELILSHYEGELQTLTSGAEANRLKLHRILGIASPAEEARWQKLLENFRE